MAFSYLMFPPETIVSIIFNRGKPLVYTHPRFRDVVMVVIKRHFIGDKVKAKVQWRSKDLKLLFGSEKIEMPLSKWREFYKVYI